MSSLDKHEPKDGVDPHLYSPDGRDEEVGIVAKGGKLHTELKGRHMQMIAIGRHSATYNPISPDINANDYS